ncbi:MAG: c-type cytochrome [Alphaproteobacteria bacterium]|nr:c-type cytochrome [Alphaproteobacteria bacterium]
MKDHLKSSLVVLASLATLWTGTASADEGDLRRAGRELAGDLCAGCHAIAEDQRGAVVDGAPAFPALARSSLTAAQLQAALTTPHPVMPEMPLSRRDVDALLAYIRSFAD